MNINILYEDNDFLAIDKPSGISVHKDGKNKEETVADWFVEKFPSAQDVGEPFFLNGIEIKRPGIVHRLDKETSGVMILAKNQEAHQFLKKQFQEHSVIKKYIALVYGHIKNDEGVIDKPIGRSPNDFRKKLAGRGAKGELREAVTEYKVLKRIEDEEGNKYSFLELFPKTGRTHQIRVHLKFLSYPIVCDRLYASKNHCPVSIGRLALHASSIEFKNLKMEKIQITSKAPAIFSNF